ncbi:hypothetical protein SAMN06297229_1398 [Pseudidiomarina planktonica]|uniref:Uncharacterized protein n=1 Tax=Pseudidiomarina planktonica TaxID=1323738 RepID=A0A1Y6EUR0_9GAMM|nr:DUF1414 domain-containing protein [Pseudidiomarina planktonica]RUO65224.1 DUF1414 domain-containing protein [Pseudidiomarina planktonica]SMQ65939.1 hypothetical protein SAMN06297229_1398 [Pseudidiomarina planktonica]
MPILSKYDAQQQQQLLEQVLDVFSSQQTPANLALMTLGNAVSNVIEQGYSDTQRKAVAEQFGKVLLQSLTTAPAASKNGN